MLSIADFFLAMLWTVGGGLWLEGSFARSGSDRDGCFAILLATVVSLKLDGPMWEEG